MLNSQSVLRNDLTSYCLARWVWDLFWVEFVFFFIVLAPSQLPQREDTSWEWHQSILSWLFSIRLIQYGYGRYVIIIVMNILLNALHSVQKVFDIYSYLFSSHCSVYFSLKQAYFIFMNLELIVWWGKTCSWMLEMSTFSDYVLAIQCILQVISTGAMLPACKCI